MSWQLFWQPLRECKGLFTTLVLLRPLQPSLAVLVHRRLPWNLGLDIAPMEAKRSSPRPAESFVHLCSVRSESVRTLRAYFTWGLGIARNILLLTDSDVSFDDQSYGENWREHT